MSRTVRHYIGGFCRDGKKDSWKTSIARDSRVSGRRTQKNDRRVARIFLKTGQCEKVISGKRSRYSLQYGHYEL